MTRPKKDKFLAKTKDIHLRMNEIEYEILLERATAANITVSDCISMLSYEYRSGYS